MHNLRQPTCTHWMRRVFWAKALLFLLYVVRKCEFYFFNVDHRLFFSLSTTAVCKMFLHVCKLRYSTNIAECYERNVQLSILLISVSFQDVEVCCVENCYLLSAVQGARCKLAQKYSSVEWTFCPLDLCALHSAARFAQLCPFSTYSFQAPRSLL